MIQFVYFIFENSFEANFLSNKAGNKIADTPGVRCQF